MSTDKVSNRNRALVYARLSGVEDDELSPEIQIKKCTEIIARDGYIHNAGRDVYQDTDKGMHSARKRDNIPQWYALLERVKADPSIAAVCVYDLQRAFRDVTAMLSEAEQLARSGVTLVRVRGGPIDLHSADGRRRAIDDANNAEYESRKTSERLRDHYQELRDLNINYSHTAPLGLQRTGKRHKVVWSTTDDFKTIVLLCEIYVADDIGSPLIARALNKKGCTWINRKGERVPIKPTTIRKTINTIEKYGPFLPPALYENVLRTREARAGRKRNSPRRELPTLLLRRVLYCSKCKCRYTTMHQQVHVYRGKKQYAYDVYIHRGENCDVEPRTLRAYKINAQVMERLDWLQHLSKEEKQTIVERMCEAPAGEAVDARHLRDKITLQLRNLESAYLAEDFGPLEEARAGYRKRRAELEKRLAELPPESKTRRVGAAFANQQDARTWLDHLTETLALAEIVAPEEANRLMRDLFERIEIDGRNVKTVKYHEEIERWFKGFDRVGKV